MTRTQGRHLLEVADLGVEGIREVLGLAEAFAEVSARPIPKLPTLLGASVAMLFFEDSTRTRLSFEVAAKRLSADILGFSAGSSSMSKGESLRDTVATVEALGADIMVVRHRSAGVPAQISRWVSPIVINAGDGCHEHPTQALLDCFTLMQAIGRPPGSGDLAGVRIGVVGDIAHSRVARSLVAALSALSAEITLIGPASLLPTHADDWPVRLCLNLDEVLDQIDVLYLLRLQTERGAQGFIPSAAEYSARYGLTADRFAKLGTDVLVMHPGPVNRGVEIDGSILDCDRVLIGRQVAAGVVVRMGVLYRTLEPMAGTK